MGESGTIDRKWLLIRPRPFMYGDRWHLPVSGPLLRGCPSDPTHHDRERDSDMVASSAALQQAHENSYHAETCQDDQGSVVCWDPPDLITLYDVNPHGQDEATESPTCAGWRLTIGCGVLRRLLCLDGTGMPCRWWLDRAFTSSAPTRHECDGNDQKSFSLIGCAKGAPHR